MVVKRIHLQLLGLAPLIFGYSYFLISNYLYGDQVSYRGLYAALAATDFLDIPITAKNFIDASDVLSFYFLWIGAHFGIDKDIYISLANTLMLLSLFVLARKYNINYTMILLLFCNYYIVVLMTGAERLKFAFIFLFLSDIVRDRKLKIPFLVSSVFAHLQSLILLPSLVFIAYKDNLSSFLKKRNFRPMTIISFLAVGVIGGLLFYSNIDEVATKFDLYEKEGSVFSSLQIVVFLSLGLFFIKNKLSFFIVLLPLLLATFFIGGNRVNMIAVFVGVYMFWREQRGNHPFLYIVMIYFFFKSIQFILNIVDYGEGFYGGT